jgi:thiol:disulfide interchange protein DsbD
MFKIKPLLISLFFLAVTGGTAFASMLTTERTETSLYSEVNDVRSGQKFWVVLEIKLKSGWHTYWKNAGDSGIPPTLTWTLPNGFSASDIHYLAPDREKVGPLMDYAYSNNAYYLVEITPASILRENTTSILALKASWLVCNDICIPESGNLSLALPATGKEVPTRSPYADKIADLVARLPVPLAEPLSFFAKDGEVHFTLRNKNIPYDKIVKAEFFPATEGLIANAAEQKTKIDSDKLSFTVKQAEGTLADSASGLISIFAENGARKDFEVRLQTGAPAADESHAAANTGTKTHADIWGAVLFAFLGGLILNLMPCVFPILSLKALAVAKKADAHPDTVRAQGIAYTVGVIVSFLLLASVLILLRSGGQAVGWGYQMQSPVFVASLAVLMFAVGLNLSGYFELPVLFGNVGAETAGKRNLFGSFTTGILAVMVATPCTAPFMAPALGFALTCGAPVVLAIFTSLGFGFASPFLLISIFPRMVSLLPKPGEWMNIFKQFLAFPIYLTVVWLLWVLTREAGADAGSITLVSMVIVTFALWLWHRESSVARFVALVVAIGGLSFTTAMVHTVPASQAMIHKQAEPFSAQRLDELRKQGKAVLVDATADWCITCKVNEAVALSSPKVMRAFADRQITYMVADWTHGDMDITRFLESFGRSGVPIYVFYPANNGAPVVLPQILTESIVLEATQ